MVLAGATAAEAATTITFNLTGNSATSGTDANVRTFTGSDGISKVRVTGWSIQGNLVRDSYLGAYGNGLGVTSGDETGGNNTHVTDNQNRIDFLLFQFDQDVEFVSGKFTTFSVNGAVSDSDATLKYGSTLVDYTNQATFNALLNNGSLASLNALFDGTFDSAGTGAGGLRDFGPGGVGPSGFVGNLWLVAASFNGPESVQCNNRGCKTSVDGFKFSNLTVNTVPSIPEPATWAMMIAGFGLTGAAIRRRRTLTAVTA